jgi:hypothetical protein
MKVVPTTAAPWADTVPPWAATMALTMDRPNPAPPWVLDRDGSER